MDVMLSLVVPTVSILLFITYSIIIAIFRGRFTGESRMYDSDEERISTLVVLGSGGHTSEMLRLISVLDNKKYEPKMFMVAETDTSSRNKLNDIKSDNEILVIPRSREVRQSWISTILTTINATLCCFRLLWKHRPKLLLCNGPGTCVPPCLVAWFYNKVLMQKTKIVFVESICRIKTLSLTGKILRYFADACLVQWPELATQDHRVKYITRFT